MATDPVEDSAALETDPGSTGALIQTQHPSPVNGVHEDIDPHLVAHPPYQRDLSSNWVKNESAFGWNPALGYGIVVNRVPLKAHMSRSAAEVDALAVTYAEQHGIGFVYEVIIGQHRSFMARDLGLGSIPALVLDDLDDDEAALLFTTDARTTRPLRGYDVHVAALTRSEPRAVAIQAAIDERGLILVPSGLTDGKVSCIRAFEKICGKDVTTPDTQSLAWVMDVMLIAFPKAKWPDPIVHGLELFRRLQVKEGVDLSAPKALGQAAYRKYKGDPKNFSDKVRELARNSTSPSPHVAADAWDTVAQSIKSKRNASRYADVDG